MSQQSAACIIQPCAVIALPTIDAEPKRRLKERLMAAGAPPSPRISLQLWWRSCRRRSGPQQQGTLKHRNRGQERREGRAILTFLMHCWAARRPANQPSCLLPANFLLWARSAQKPSPSSTDSSTAHARNVPGLNSLAACSKNKKRPLNELYAVFHGRQFSAVCIATQRRYVLLQTVCNASFQPASLQLSLT